MTRGRGTNARCSNDKTWERKHLFYHHVISAEETTSLSVKDDRRPRRDIGREGTSRRQEARDKEVKGKLDDEGPGKNENAKISTRKKRELASVYMAVWQTITTWPTFLPHLFSKNLPFSPPFASLHLGHARCV